MPNLITKQLGLLFLTSVSLAQSPVTVSCPPCDLSECESVDHCIAGVLLDTCKCCQVCARSEGELCDKSNVGDLGMCGDNLECTTDKETEEQLCLCTDTKMVCGSDGVSYETPCQLNEQSVRRSADTKQEPLKMEYWGPCKHSPVIVTPPTDTFGPKGANLTLDCEARGFPAPDITWQYENMEGNTISLPSDDQMISVQMRGGPEPLMATGWAQIISLDPSYSGIYRCIASNSLGKVHATATVGVYREEV